MSQDINKVECTEQITKDCYCYVCTGGKFRRVKISDLLALEEPVVVGLPEKMDVDLSTLWTPDAYRYSAAITNIIKFHEDYIGYGIETIGVVATPGTMVKFVLYTADVAEDNTCTLTQRQILAYVVADSSGIAKHEMGGYRIEEDNTVIMAHAESASIGCLAYGTSMWTIQDLPYFDDANYYNTTEEITCNITTQDNRVAYGTVPLYCYCMIREIPLDEYVYGHEKAFLALNEKVENLLPEPNEKHDGMFVQVVDGKYDLVKITDGNEVKY